MCLLAHMHGVGKWVLTIAERLPQHLHNCGLGLPQGGSYVNIYLQDSYKSHFSLAKLAAAWANVSASTSTVDNTAATIGCAFVCVCVCVCVCWGCRSYHLKQHLPVYRTMLHSQERTACKCVGVFVRTPIHTECEGSQFTSPNLSGTFGMMVQGTCEGFSSL